MALNVKMALYRGTLAHLQALATTGQQGVLAWTTDSNELYVDSGAGSPGVGAGNAWQKVANTVSVQNAASAAAMIALTADLGDMCIRTDLNQLFILTAYPASTVGNWTAIAPSSAVTGVVGLSGPTANEWVAYIDSSGVQHLSQPSFANISNTLAQSQLPASIGAGSNLTSFDCGTF